ncbi:MAG: dihydroxyacetone kinase phosphoryl donor subunit DhaM [Anaeromicrobium sp.]|jgi:dihydroxyacetone kinase phosphotransfer subunit|uniref:dihydroxyacetone kinase phosphoryl donor subunit DhaM n=1 Tax=Anaeromicrobium sp. TaxID=1929132 RepID=UPI0025EF3608|nr:dihydroxyacetone kinase phosphoryl donor subunit DhaM [Anaeromicrobium sp.]MCT4596128.1 dihydroxyacetone kinase phosphoryl donor subunit DhaM [Anaeromicrobium sp.]
MVGIVIVSHSNKLAEEIIKLSMQMCQSKDLKVAAAGGTFDNRFGTDANRIMEAITEVDTGDGVVILVDLGSAIMSAEMSIEFLGDEVAKNVHIADAPIVEGAIAAVSQASIGATLQEVISAAEDAKNYPKK